jgi:DNA-binding transcriptional regulator YiaG
MTDDDPTDAELEATWRRELADLFRECRHTLKLSQFELAQILAPSGRGHTIGKWERGTQQIPGTAWLALLALMMADDQRELAEKLLNAESGPVSPQALAFFAVRLGTDPPYGYKLVSANGDDA